MQLLSDQVKDSREERDNDRLLATLKLLRDQGNTVIVVEHDPATILRADHVVDFGPGPGIHGGLVVYSGSVEGLLADPIAYLHPSLVNDLWVVWVNDAIRSADIEVSSQVGTWTHNSHGILPPPTG